MTPRSSGGPWPAFSVLAVMPIFDRVCRAMIASWPFALRMTKRRARRETSIVAQNSSSHRSLAMLRVCAA
jgi:hypothetical protein